MQWLTVSECKEVARCGSDLIYSLVDRGLVISRRVGNRGRGGAGTIQIRRDSLDAYLASRQKGGMVAPVQPQTRAAKMSAEVQSLCKRFGL